MKKKRTEIELQINLKRAFSRTRARAHSRSFYVFAVTSVTEIIVKHYGTMICDIFVTFI